MSPPSATVRDAAKLLDINVDQLARLFDFVATGRGPADRQAGGLIDALQLRHPVAGQDPPDGRAWHAQVIADPVRPPSVRALSLFGL